MAATAEISSRIEPEIQAALDETDPMARTRRMRETIRDAFLIAYDDETPARSENDAALAADAFVASMLTLMLLTHPDDSEGQATRIAEIIATAAVNGAVVAAHPETRKTWRTMRDDRVRDLHAPLDGVSVAAGDPFDVGGFQLQYPGQPIGPPEVWINCRCTLAAGATLTSGGPMGDYSGKVNGECPEGKHLMPDGSCMDDDEMDDDELTAAVNEEPWSNWTAADYNVQQWHRACLIHLHSGPPTSKSECKLPVRTPSGALNRAGVHAAAAALAGARGGVDAPAAKKAAARRSLLALYRRIGDDPPDSLRADGALDETVQAATGTRDGPGWLTNPRDTQRLRDYWTKGAGAAKIAWGTPGDFNRCRANLGKYVSNPSYLAGTCANLHKVALGFWPATHAAQDRGRHAAAPPAVPDFDPDFDTEEFAAVTAAFAAADEAVDLPLAEWFTDPGLDAPTPLTVTDDGRVVGHLATFDTCHVGVAGSCQMPPRSKYDYAYFRTGEMLTSSGPVPVGQITMDTGHAGTDLGPTAAVAHYDDTGTVVADVAAGEDAHGIWVAGMARPGVTEAQMRTLRAGALSGDWRRIGGNLELVAALVVNVPGFPIPRVQVASAGGNEFALTAAAVVTIDPNAVDADRVAIAVLAAMDQRAADAVRRQRAAELAAEITELRVDALSAAVEG